MCGIIGIYDYGASNVIDKIVGCLKNIEYRGYDSVGFAFFDEQQQKIIDKKFLGTISSDIVQDLEGISISPNAGIGHTRWATHGSAHSIHNVHPHTIDNISIVHNGTLGNIQKYQDMLLNEGYKFTSETDTEIALKLIHFYTTQGYTVVNALMKAKRCFNNLFTSVILYYDASARQNIIVGSCGDTPILVGNSNDGIVLCSDMQAISEIADEIIPLEQGDLVIVRDNKLTIKDTDDNIVHRKPMKFSKIAYKNVITEGSFQYNLHREIFEQKDRSLHVYTSIKKQIAQASELIDRINSSDNLFIIGCGTSFYASEYAKHVFRSLAPHISVLNEVGSEYSNYNITQNDTVIAISQSGETQDVLKAICYAKKSGAFIASIVNTPYSAIARKSDISFHTELGREISVASTKAFMGQMIALLALSMSLSKDKNKVNAIDQEMQSINDMILHAIRESELAITQSKIGHQISKSEYVLFTANKNLVPITKEAALKLKEIGYIYSEGMPSGEIKHGTLALATSNVTVVALAHKDSNYMEACIATLAARNTDVVLIKSKDFKYRNKYSIDIGEIINDEIAPLVFAVPVQLISYWSGVYKGNEIDMPRNLSKSITVD